MQLHKIFMAASIGLGILGLAACGDKPSEQAPLAIPHVVVGPSQAELEKQKKQREADELASKELEEKKVAEANEAMTLTVTNILERLAKLKTPTPAENQELVSLVDDAPYLGGIMSNAMYSLVEKNAVKPKGYASNGTDEQKRLISGILVWAQQNPAVVDKIVDGALPYLKTKTDFVTAMRETKGLLMKPYSDKGFATLLMCSKGIKETDEARKLCKEEAAKFSVAYTDGAAGVGDSYSRNTIWVVEFLNRRSLNGGEKFAQMAQRQMLKVAK